MTRPTREAVDALLRRRGGPDYEGLKAEVRALREELAKADKSLGSLGIKLGAAEEEARKATFAAQLNAKQRDELRATIARVEALPAKWRCRDNRNDPVAVDDSDVVKGMDYADLFCADELESALKGSDG